MHKVVKVKQESIKTVVNNNEALTLIEFSNANLKRQQNNIKFELYKGDTIYNKRKRICVASTPRLQYSGANDEREMFKITSTLLKVAVLNKQTNRMKLYDVDYFLLKPRLTGNIQEDATDRSRIKMNQDLALEFGSKNKKKGVNSMLKFQSNDNIDESLLNNVLQNMNSLKEDSTETDSKPETDSIIPPQNKNAANVSEVYNIFDIISQDEYLALESEMTIFKNASYEDIKSWKADEKYSAVIIDFLERHLQIISDDNAKLLCYLHYLICFLRLNYKDTKKKDPVPDVPQPFRRILMDRYMINRSLPQRMKDKLLANAIVIYLQINGYSIDTRVLSQSTKVSIKRSVDMAYALGCHVHASKHENTKRIELKLPLYVYVPFGSKKK